MSDVIIIPHGADLDDEQDIFQNGAISLSATGKPISLVSAATVTYYDTFAEAAAHAVSGDTVCLLSAYTASAAESGNLPPGVTLKTGQYDFTNNGGITFRQDTVQGNTGLFLNNGTMAVTSTLFSANSVSSHGGAITNYASALITGSTFSGNTATAQGGALLNSGTANVLQTVFSDNSASSAGALYNAGNIFVQGAVFSGNTSKWEGAALYNSSVSEITGSTFSGNQTKYYGGAIANHSLLNLDKSVLAGNSAATGGAVYNAEGTTSVGQSAFSENFADYGGAVYQAKKTGLLLNDSVLSGQTASYYGGAIANFGNATISRTSFAGNSAATGGAIYNSGTAAVTDSAFTGNKVSETGGAVYNKKTVTISGSTFSGNTAATAGAIFNSDTISIDGGIFLNNSAATGGAIYNSGLAAISHVFFAGNTATGGSAVYNAPGAELFFGIGCVFDTAGDTICAVDSDLTVSYDFISKGSITLDGTAKLHFRNENAISFEGTLLTGNKAAISFESGRMVSFTDAQNFSATNISMTVDWTLANSFTVASGSLTFASKQTISVNGSGFTLGDTAKVGEDYLTVACITSENTQRLVASKFHIMIDSSDKQTGTVKFADVVKNGDAAVIGFNAALAGETISKTSLGTNNLIAGNTKTIIGRGAKNTIVKANLFGSGYALTLSDLTWDGYIFGGGNGSHENKSSQTLTLTGNISAVNVFAGSRIATASEKEGSSSLVLADDVSGTFSILCAGNLVSAAATESGNTAITVSGSGIDNSKGFVIGGSVINKDIAYTARGTASTRIDAGVHDWVAGGGFINYNGGTYTHDGNINMQITGGTVRTVFGGIASSQAKYGTKTVKGDISISFDCSTHSISLFSVFAGNNGIDSSVTGNITVTFSGLGSNLNFTGDHNGVVGDSATTQRTVTGTRTFQFSSFIGTFNAQAVKKFDVMNVVQSDVYLSVWDLSGISEWNFDTSGFLHWTDGGTNDFSGDKLNITGTFEQSDNGFSFFTAGKACLVDGWDKFGAVSLFGENATFDSNKASWVSDHYLLTCTQENDEYKLSVTGKLA